jgi:hypothetical protein
MSDASPTTLGMAPGGRLRGPAFSDPARGDHHSPLLFPRVFLDIFILSINVVFQHYTDARLLSPQ